MNFDNAKYKRILTLSLYAFAVALAFAGLFFVASRLLLPFVLAWLFALALRPLCKKAQKYFGFSKRITNLILCLCILLLSIGLLVFIFCFLFGYLKRLPDFIDGIIQSAKILLDKVLDFLSEYFNLPRPSTKELYDKYAQSMTKPIVEAITSLISQIVKNAPKIFLSFMIFLLSCVYFTVDFENISSYISKFIPSTVKSKWSSSKGGFLNVLTSYFKAHFLMLLITFLTTYIGLLLLGYKNAWFLSFFIAFIDFLPAIGLGSVFVPWIAFHFIMGSTQRALYLLVLFLVCEIVTQVLGPHIVGAHLGLHPVATLIGLYVGFKLFGILGMLLSPIVVLLIKYFLDNYLIKLG